MNALNKPFIAERRAEPFDTDLQVVVARTLNDMMQVMTVRALVYMGEQVCPYDEEFDGNDLAGATHLILKRGAEPIGVVRLRWFSDFAKLERLSIRQEFRGGPGLLILSRAAVRLAERKGYRRLMGHVQARVIPFWKRYFRGRQRDGRATFAFSDYDYVEMEMELHPPHDAITIDSDPFVILRPEGDWDQPGVLDQSAARFADLPRSA
jgi:predicted GNAT family N-acyltransferase